MVNKDFFEALDILAVENKIVKEHLIASLEAGLASAYKKECGESRAVTVNLNPKTNAIKIFAYHTVVEGEPTVESELSLEEARDIKPDAQIGDVIGEDVHPKHFSRIAAQTAKQVIMQRINEAKKEQVMNEMNEKEGELMQAIIRRIEKNTVYVEIIGSQMEGVMQPSDQIPGELLRVNDRIKVFVKKVRATTRGSQVIVSRSCTGFVKKLFEAEVPELRGGLIKVKNIVREAGYRTKMAVYSDSVNDDSFDASGSCIGPKGSRVNAVVQELNGEKVDIIHYTEDPMDYIMKSLSPARVTRINLLDDNSVRVFVPDDKLSLAIGKSGQNARLAARLTGYKIDVKPASMDMTDFEEIQESPENY